MLNRSKSSVNLMSNYDYFAFQITMVGGRYLMLKSKLISGASIATISIAMTIPAQAQSAIDEVVVTARKKAESLQDVPIAVSALDEKATR